MTWQPSVPSCSSSSSPRFLWGRAGNQRRRLRKEKVEGRGGEGGQSDSPSEAFCREGKGLKNLKCLNGARDALSLLSLRFPARTSFGFLLPRPIRD